MQLWDVEPVIGRFQQKKFDESEAGPYFVLYMMLLSLGFVFSSGEQEPLEILSSIISVIITLFGIIYLKEKNGGFGNHFVSKYFILGWMVTVRLICIFIPLAFLIALMARDFGGKKSFDAVSAGVSIVAELIFWGWLGFYVDRSNQLQPSEDKELEVIS